MKISLIIPVYNVEKYIIDCLNSIYDGNLKKFEVICIDDRGNDKSIDIIKKYVKENNIKNLQIIKHDKNKGLSEARNTGLVTAKGKYVMFLDSDDMINSSELNYIVDYAINNDLDIVEGEIEEIFETSLNIRSKKGNIRKDTKILTGDEYFFESSNKSEYVPMVWCRIYKLNYIKNKYKFMSGLKFEDEEFSPRVIINAKKVQYLNRKIYIYRRRDDSITTNMVKNVNWISHYLTIIDSLTNYSREIIDKKSYFVLKERIANLVLSLLKNSVAYKASKENVNYVKKVIKENKLYKIPCGSKRIITKIQGYLMRFPKLFIILYSCVGRCGTNEK